MKGDMKGDVKGDGMGLDVEVLNVNITLFGYDSN